MYNQLRLKKTCGKLKRRVASCNEWQEFYVVLAVLFEDIAVDVNDISWKCFKIEDYIKYLPPNATKEQTDKLCQRIFKDFQKAYEIYDYWIFSD